MPRPVLPGETFDYWTVIDRDSDAPRRNCKWMCRCRCGVIKSVQSTKLQRGLSRSCGCRNGMGSQVRHGMNSNTVMRNAWVHIRHRCLNPKYGTYKYYGGRGVKVCSFIRESPRNLLYVIGNRPNRNLTIDRINNEGHYSCGTCDECLKNNWPINIRWATMLQQAHNKREYGSCLDVAA